MNKQLSTTTSIKLNAGATRVWIAPTDPEQIKQYFYGTQTGCSQKMKTFLEAFATPYDLSGPCPTASLATLLTGLEINGKRGDEYRKKLWDNTKTAIDGLRGMGFTVMNKTGFPIASVWIGDTDDLIATANILYDEGILVTAASYPMVRKGDECHRLTFTSANTEEEVQALIKAFAKVKEYLVAAGKSLAPQQSS